jgi:hypothetical protein
MLTTWLNFDITDEKSNAVQIDRIIAPLSNLNCDKSGGRKKRKRISTKDIVSEKRKEKKKPKDIDPPSKERNLNVARVRAAPKKMEVSFALHQVQVRDNRVLLCWSPGFLSANFHFGSNKYNKHADDLLN